MRNYETKVFDYVDKKSGAHIVKAVTMYAGSQVSAIAKCDPEDNFDLKFGTDVALKRLDIKMAQKRKASMRDYTAFCELNLKFIETEKQRVQKALERAKHAIDDRTNDIKKYEVELAEMLATTEV